MLQASSSSSVISLLILDPPYSSPPGGDLRRVVNEACGLSAILQAVMAAFPAGPRGYPNAIPESGQITY